MSLYLACDSTPQATLIVVFPDESSLEKHRLCRRISRFAKIAETNPHEPVPLLWLQVDSLPEL